MAVAVIDTGVLVGMADSDDEHHDVAMEIVHGMDHGKLPFPPSLGGNRPGRSLREGFSRGLPFYASDEAGGLYSPLTFSVPRFKRTSTGAPPSSAFCRRRRYCKPTFFAAL